MLSLLTFAVVIFPILFGFTVEIVPKNIRENSLWRGGVVFFGIILTGLTYLQVHMADGAHEKEMDGQRHSTEEIKGLMEAGELRNASDMGFLKGQMVMALANRPSPTLDANKLAATLTKHVKDEMGVLSNKELVDGALKFCQELRVFEADFDKHRFEALTNYLTESRQAASNPVRSEDLRSRWEQGDQLARADFQYEYRTKFMGRAIYFRDALRQALGTPNQRDPREADLALEGFLAGVHPVADVAAYLESLANALATKNPT